MWSWGPMARLKEIDGRKKNPVPLMVVEGEDTFAALSVEKAERIPRTGADHLEQMACFLTFQDKRFPPGMGRKIE